MAHSTKRGRVDLDESGHDGTASLPHRKATLKSIIVGLNQQFARWVEEQQSEHVAELWSDGIRDYLSHVDELLQDFSDLIDNERQSKVGRGSASTAPNLTPAASPAFSFGVGATPLTAPASSPALFKTNTRSFGQSDATPAAEAPFGSAAPAAAAPPVASGFAKPSSTATLGGFGGSVADPAPKPVFSFGGAPAAAANAGKDETAPRPASVFGSKEPAPFLFGSSAAEPSAPKPAMFSFGAAAENGGAAAKESGAVPSGGSMFAFGGAATATTSAAAPTSGGFSFGSSAAPFSFGGGGAAAAPASVSGQAADEEDEPAKFESEVAVNEEAGTVVFKAKSKFLHFQKEGPGAWEGKGIGTLMLRQRGDDPKKVIVTFTTEAGRVLYITNLPKTMAVILSETKATASFSAPWSPEGGSTPTLQMVMFQLPKGKHVEFKAAIEKLQAEMP